MAGGSLNLKQIMGGAAIKQGDTNTKLGYELLDNNNGPMYSDIMEQPDNMSIKVVLTELKTKTSIITPHARIWNGTVIFWLPKEATPGMYDVEIGVTVDGDTSIFPSTYASATLEIVKSGLLVNPSDPEVKYINVASLPSMDDIDKLETDLIDLKDDVISIINTKLKALRRDIGAVDDSLKTIKEDISKKVDASSLIPINTSITNLEEAVKKMPEYIDDALDRVATNRDNIEACTSKVNKIQDTIIPDLQKSIADIRTQLTKLGANI